MFLSSMQQVTRVVMKVPELLSVECLDSQCQFVGFPKPGEGLSAIDRKTGTKCLINIGLPNQVKVNYDFQESI